MSTFVDILGATVNLFPVRAPMRDASGAPIVAAGSFVDVIGAQQSLDLGNGHELVLLGALMAPGSRGLAVQMDLGDDQILRAQICIDGACYEGTMDISPALAAISERLATWHSYQHGGAADSDKLNGPGANAPEPDEAETTEHVVAMCGELLVGDLVDAHADVISAGWLRSLKKAVSKVGKAARKTLKKLKTPITIAAAAAATVAAGPAGGALAGKLTGPILDAATGDGSAKKAIEAVEAEAKTNPKLAKAYSTAKKAVANTTIAYQLVETADAAKNGDPAAIKKLMEVETEAKKGDPAALQAAAIMSQAERAAQANAGAAGSATVSGAAVSTLAEAKQRAARAATAKHERSGARVLGFALLASGPSVLLPFDSLDDADDWYGSLPAGSIRYAACFDVDDPIWPMPVQEKTGGPRSFAQTKRNAIAVGASAAQMSPAKTAFLKAVMDQDSRWARIAQRAQDRKHPRAKSLRDFIRTGAPFGSASDPGWDGVVKMVIERLPEIPEAQMHAAENEWLYGIHHALYPRARAAGFPESSFLFPDIEIDAETISGHWLLPMAAGAGALALTQRGWGWWKGYRANRAAMLETQQRNAADAQAAASVTLPSDATTTAGKTIVRDSAKAIRIPMLSEDGDPMPGHFVAWHPTREQIAAFGSKRPAFFVLDEGGLFLFADPKHGQPIHMGPLEGMKFTAFAPTWNVRELDATISGDPTMLGAWGDDAEDQATQGKWRRWREHYTHGKDARYVVLELGLEGRSLRWIDFDNKKDLAIAKARSLAHLHPFRSMIYVFDAQKPGNPPLVALNGVQDLGRVTIESVEQTSGLLPFLGVLGTGALGWKLRGWQGRHAAA